MKVFLGGTVNGSTWRDYVISRLTIGFFNPVVDDWKPEDLERELYERRHCNFCLYVVTPRMTGYYSLAEVIDDSIKRPDRTIFCFLHEDGGDKFDQDDIAALEAIGEKVLNNGAYVCKDLDEVVALLNTSQNKRQFEGAKQRPDTEFIDTYISYGRNDSRAIVEELEKTLNNSSLNYWYDRDTIPQEIEFLEEINTLIRESHVFLFVISQHSLNSEYCQRELEYAQKLGKTIIFLDSENTTSSASIVPDAQFTLTETQELTEFINNSKKKLSEQTRWLNLLDCWQKNNKNPDFLLYGGKRSRARNWLLEQAQNPADKRTKVTEELKEFIQTSSEQPFTARCMFQLHKLTGAVVNHNWFDRVIGFLAVANPLALLPQAWVLFVADNSDAISVSMWMIFLMLQMSSALFAIKHRKPSPVYGAVRQYGHHLLYYFSCFGQIINRFFTHRNPIYSHLKHSLGKSAQIE